MKPSELRDQDTSDVQAFFIFLSAYIFSVFYRSALAVVVPEVAADTGATLGELGVASAGWFFAFAVAQLPVGWALDRFGPRRTVGATVLLAGGGALLFASGQKPWHLVAAMAINGVGCSAALMGAVFAFTRTLDEVTSARRASWLIGLSTLGGLAAATPLSLAAAAYGWRATFAAVGLLTLASGLLILAKIKDPPQHAGDVVVGPALGFLAGIVAVMKIRGLWPILPLVAVGYAVVAAERGLWSGPYFADVHGLDPIARGNAVMVMALAMAGGAFLLGELDQITGRRKTLAISCSLLTAGAFIGLGAVPGINLITATLLLALIGMAGFTYGLLLAHGRSFLPEHLLGRGLTLINFFFIAGAGCVQLASSRAVSALQNTGVPAETLFGHLHVGFGVTLLVATGIYVFSRARA